MSNNRHLLISLLRVVTCCFPGLILLVLPQASSDAGWPAAATPRPFARTSQKHAGQGSPLTGSDAEPAMDRTDAAEIPLGG